MPPDGEHPGPAEAPAAPATPAPGRSRRALLGAGAVAVAAVAAGGAGLLWEQSHRGSANGSSITVNGKSRQVAAAPATPLLYVLRNEIGLSGPRFGCGLSQCGACTVHLDGKPVRSCVTPVSSVDGRAITTLEGLGTPDKPHPLQKAFIDQQAVQCGYCISGMVMEAAALLKTKSKPSTAEIKTALAGHLCRCGTHYRILRAVQSAAGTL